MSLELRDLRCKITVETDVVLTARARSTGRDKSEIAREILDKWAKHELHDARLMVHLAESEGLTARPGAVKG